ncbi:MAG: iron chelate uptake ABC transporter family permease subunit [Rhodobacteraceae bacterium]|nr:iron chelate uptake ABC transporter family permease subunit [Paracoccaceae bacterium]
MASPPADAGAIDDARFGFAFAVGSRPVPVRWGRRTADLVSAETLIPGQGLEPLDRICLPELVTAVLMGSTLGTASGTAMQRQFRNPLAAPGIVGGGFGAG